MDLDIGDVDIINGNIFMLRLPTNENLNSDKYQFNTLINLDKSKTKNNITPFIIINPVMETSSKLTINSGSLIECKESVFGRMNVAYKE